MVAQDRIDIVIPIHIKDLDIAFMNLPIISKNIASSRLIVLCNDATRDALRDCKTLEYLTCIDEDSVQAGLTIQSVKQILLERCGSARRAGWYFQQFIKMAYALTCDDEWYILWDADTIPLSHLSLFSDSDKPIFDLKNEYHRPYFYTMKRLIGLDKGISSSFIAEHMIINTHLMRELINSIEGNSELKGHFFWEKILYAIPWQFLNESGFSEFETYGNYVSENYPEMYDYRRLKTLRQARIIVGDSINSSIIKWASKSYDTISFEKSKTIDRRFVLICHSPIRLFISLKRLWEFYKRSHPINYIE